MAVAEASVPRVVRHPQTLRWIFPTVAFSLDLILVNIAFALAYLLRYRLGVGPHVTHEHMVQPQLWLRFELLISVIMPIWFAMGGLYRRRLGVSWLGEAFAVARAATVGMAVAIIVTYLGRNFIDEYSRIVLVMTWALIILWCGIGRAVTSMVMVHLHRRGLNVRRVLVAGSGPLSKMVIQNLHNRLDQGYSLIGFLHDNGGAPEEFGRFRNLGPVSGAAEVIATHKIDEVVIALSSASHSDIQALRDHCVRQNVTFKLVPDLFEISLSRVRMDDIAGIPLISLDDSPLRGLNLIVKRLLDVACATLVLLVLSPLLLLLALAIKLDSPGPILFKQERVGRNGHVFPFFKFRSMYRDAEQRHREMLARSIHGTDSRTAKDPRDPRRTRVGRIIRRLSIDELPQLLNVLRGEMSLVGPRPSLPSEVAKYEQWHYRRLDAQPGITGLWQVSGRSDLNFDEMIMMDIYYIDNWSLTLDLKLLLRTPGAVLSMRGAY